MMGIIKVIPLTHCELCPFGIIKGVTTKSPYLVCRHPSLKKDKKISAVSVKKNSPPVWCELVDLEELVLKNRHEVIEIIERAYGPLRISPFKKPEDGKFIPFHPKPKDWKDGSWDKTYYRRYWTTRLQQVGKKDPTYQPWLESLKRSSTKSKKRGT